MLFDSQYQKLNPAQKLAVDTLEGPVMVLAGPGTGKTHVLTLRIANILKQTDLEPHNILALTFTDSATKTMRSRLRNLVGNAANQVNIETFHALCDNIIREYPEYFPFNFDSLPITPIEQFEIVHAFLESPKLKFLRTPGSKFHYGKDILGAISSLKRENVSPDKLASLVVDEANWFQANKAELKKKELLTWEGLIGKHQELVEIYAGYQKKLTENSRYDFDDMLLETHKVLLSNPNLLQALQEEYQYFLVDEYQDTNGAQNAIVDLLASFWENPNLFVVGDPNQTIFRFQGALLENSLGFLDRYPTATVINLDKGYRSNQTIYNAAQTLVNPTLVNLTHPLTAPLSVALTADHSEGEILLTTAQNDTEELLLLVQQVKELISSGIDAGEIAVLYKRNADADALMDLFARAGIPYHTERELNALEDLDLIQFLTLLDLIQKLRSKDESRLLFDVLSYRWFSPTQQLENLNLLKLIRAYTTEGNKLTPFEFLSQTSEEIKKLKGLAEITTEQLEIITNTIKLISSWSALESQLPLLLFIEELAKESGFKDFLLTKDPRSLLSYQAFFRHLDSLAQRKKEIRLNELLEYLETMKEQKLSLAINWINRDSTVTLSTVHKAKGKEWEHVFIPFFREGYWGKSRSGGGIRLPDSVVAHSGASNAQADERRLLFVALTRAKKTAHLSWAKLLSESGRTKEALVSSYQAEISSYLKEEKITPDKELEYLFLTPKSETNLDALTRSWLSEIVENFMLSYSALNAYLEDPKTFYERYILKLPESIKPHLAYGNAAHVALEHYYRSYHEHKGVYPETNSVLPIFDDALSHYHLKLNDLESYQDKGHQILNLYLSEKSKEFPMVLATEESFGWKRGRIQVGDQCLVGKIDRIDLLPGNDHQLHVIDYKTGSQKTLGEIEGKTASSNLTPRELSLPEGIRGRLKRQLVFYKLLLSLDPKYRNYKVDKGTFEFLEPHQGKFVPRTVTLTSEDVEDLKNLILQVSQEIRELKFLSPEKE